MGFNHWQIVTESEYFKILHYRQHHWKQEQWFGDYWGNPVERRWVHRLWQWGWKRIYTFDRQLGGKLNEVYIGGSRKWGRWGHLRFPVGLTGWKVVPFTGKKAGSQENIKSDLNLSVWVTKWGCSADFWPHWPENWKRGLGWEAICFHMVRWHRQHSFSPPDLRSTSVEDGLYAGCWGYSSEQGDWVSDLNQFTIYLFQLAFNL